MLCHKCNAELPNSAILCDVCGAVVQSAPATDEAKADKRHRRINLRRQIAFCAAAAVLVIGIMGILINNSPNAVAKRYVKESMEGDLKTVMSLCTGNMRQTLEKETTKAEQAALFRDAETTAASLGLDLSVENFAQYYKALSAILRETHTQSYGEGYKLTYKVRETENMSVKEFETICAAYDSDRYGVYVDTDKLKIGKIVTVTVTVDGKDGTISYDRTVPLVKYKGAWKVVSNAFFTF